MVRFLHLLSAAVWVGGQAALFVAVPVIRPHTPEPGAILGTIGRRFGALAGPALLLLLVTGMAQASHLHLCPGQGGLGGRSWHGASMPAETVRRPSRGSARSAASRSAGSSGASRPTARLVRALPGLVPGRAHRGGNARGRPDVL